MVSLKSRKAQHHIGVLFKVFLFHFAGGANREDHVFSIIENLKFRENHR